MEQQALASLYVPVLAVAFFGWVAFGHRPGPGENVSLMRYCVGVGLISFVSVLGVLAVSYLAARTGNFDLAPGLNLVIAAMSGVALGILALGRSHDAGGGRRFAAIGIIPIVGLWLLFASPAPDPARPPYQPKNKLLRFVIGFTALLVGTALPQVLELAISGRLPNEGEPSALATEAEFAAINATMPQRLDEWTVLERLDYDLKTKEVFYRHTIDLPPDADAAGLGERIKVNAIPTICGTAELKSLMTDGFSLVYTYRTSRGTSIPGFTIRLSDCP
jgi:hypothetical protein